MTKVIMSEDCGNSPKNILIQDLTIALIKGNSDFVLNAVTDDIHWELVGDLAFKGKKGVTRKLKQKNEKPLELTIHHVATHGRAGAVNGTRKMKSGKTIAFCNVYVFGNTKGTVVREITSYEIDTK
jgi:hypothetical protein